MWELWSLTAPSLPAVLGAPQSDSQTPTTINFQEKRSTKGIAILGTSAFADITTSSICGVLAAKLQRLCQL
ncbi:hypothetical protein BV20DRAFT_962903 [Pilatotrama ljubarskyi]|nr:hypothetical protein BV20DRAFT_962903 [Pilatotrama ljubarskyi]